MLVKNLIACLNSSLPTLEDIKSKFQKIGVTIDNSKALTYQQEQKVIYREIRNLTAKDAISELVESTNLSLVGIGTITIYDQVDLLDNDLIEFASLNDFFRICSSRRDSSILWYNEESDEKELITLSIMDFFHFLCEYNKYHKSLAYGCEFDADGFTKNLTALIARGFSKKFISYLIDNWKIVDADT